MLKSLKRYLFMAGVLFFFIPLPSANASSLRINVYPEHPNPVKIVVRYGPELKANYLDYPYEYIRIISKSETVPYLLEFTENIVAGTTYYCAVKDEYSDGTESQFSESSMAILTHKGCSNKLLFVAPKAPGDL